jgi:hypothetical protein
MFRLLAEPKVDELIQNKILLRMDIDLPDGRTIIHLLSPLKCTLSKLIPFPHRIQIGFETTVQVLMRRKVLKRSPTCTQWDFLVSLFHASQHSTCDGRDAMAERSA